MENRCWAMWSGCSKCATQTVPSSSRAIGRTFPAYRPLSLFRSEIAENGSPKGVMVNSPAQAVGTFGKGRVFISSPHPENTPGLEHLIPRGILWAAGEGVPLN
jgi:hypothetical protein